MKQHHYMASELASQSCTTVMCIQSDVNR